MEAGLERNVGSEVGLLPASLRLATQSLGWVEALVQLGGKVNSSEVELFQGA